LFGHGDHVALVVPCQQPLLLVWQRWKSLRENGGLGDTGHMITGVVVAVVVVLVGAWLVFGRGGKEGRAVRKELRDLRNAEKRVPNTAGAAEHRRNMMMDPVPGKDTMPGGA
jgi:hypothetical protein